MAIKFLSSLEVDGNITFTANGSLQLINASFQQVTADPTTNNFEGRMIYRTDTDKIRYYDGTNYQDVGTTYTLPTATTTVLGGVKIDDSTIGISNSVISIKDSGVTLGKIANIADDTILGNVSGSAAAPSALTAANVRTMINVADGANAYSLPTAAADTLGGIKIGTDLAISSGVVNLDPDVISSRTAIVNGNYAAATDFFLYYDASADTLLKTSVDELEKYMQANLTFTTNSFRTVTAGGNTLGASETLAFTAGTNISISESAGAVTITATDTNDDVSKANLITALASFTSEDTVNIGDSGDDTTVIIRGNLQVDGTTTTVNSATLDIADNEITLNSDLATDTAPTENASIIVNRRSGTDTAIRWNESTDRWQFTNDGSTYVDFVLADTNTQRSDESVRDVTTAQIVTNGSHTNITVTDDDSGNGIDFSVATATSSALGVARVDAGEGIDVTVSSGVFTVAGEDASTSNKGIIEIATSSETTTGTDTARAVTPKGLADTMYSATLVSSGDANITVADSNKTWTLRHNLGSRDVHVSLRQAGSPYKQVFVDSESKDTNNTVLRFTTNPGDSNYVVFISRVVG
jgi:hypothetical protein